MDTYIKHFVLVTLTATGLALILASLTYISRCGDYHDGCEPDAENYPCYGCGKKKVFAAEALLMRVGGLFKRRVA